MKKIIATAALACFLFSCFRTGVTGNGNIKSETRDVSNFTGISSSSSINVEVAQGASYSVTAEADENLLQYLKTKVENGVLRIYLGNNISIHNGKFNVKVTAPSITYLKASSSSDIETVTILKADKQIQFEASSSATIKAAIDAPEVKADASSSATIELTGKTKNMNAEASSSADIKAFELLSENTKAHASSSGTVNVFASVLLSARASSSGDINYRGNAVVEKTISSSGSVDKDD